MRLERFNFNIGTKVWLIIDVLCNDIYNDKFIVELWVIGTYISGDIGKFVINTLHHYSILVLFINERNLSISNALLTNALQMAKNTSA